MRLLGCPDANEFAAHPVPEHAGQSRLQFCLLQKAATQKLICWRIDRANVRA
jgi:hypothetical protein